MGICDCLVKGTNTDKLIRSTSSSIHCGPVCTILQMVALTIARERVSALLSNSLHKIRGSSLFILAESRVLLRRETNVHAKWSDIMCNDFVI